MTLCNEQQYDFLVFIGRFQPFHQGHLRVVKEGLKRASQVIILCGSAHQPRTVRNPWTSSERELMIRGTLSAEENSRVHTAPLMDTVYNDDAWVRNVQTTVKGIVTAQHRVPHKTPLIGLIGHSKDQSSYYLNMFPQWQSVPVENYQAISATPLRKHLFSAQSEDFLSSEDAQKLPLHVRGMLDKFMCTADYHAIRNEHEFIEKYRQAWQTAPYPPTFVTVDAVVVQSGHVLLIERKARPGKGLWALPGGFIDGSVKLIDACLRELREETKLKVPAPVLKGSIKQQRVFDDPHRSARGRTITHAFYFDLAPNNALPKVKGADDAKHAMWVPLAELEPCKLFEDHYFIIQELTGM
ncbi:bifunctional nicotinamide-nucleotide adenylyltransferase/Nudix hydroxylase [Pseudoalteromonas luteoviolacea]|uniref:bifunctional nicotinamide-nucleotide adenylyltransferase/Nudix hydroxylase n=1 Tax=Pseudoalteromonas luteoviolacea TaxID=43657 RepID=UPI001B36566E|nr:bifunctional nicotinamide-nucleotide adenylyltransferase/Nudix hydroxylase [Pseudoalteromonas luteoviolacea]MBQ4836248.1 bifunctional nicotinamide-nucleotide adenylyltransferase/Nudix hydroxylase [Pseudoalteromonas luteoviolacea]